VRAPPAAGLAHVTLLAVFGPNGKDIGDAAAPANTRTGYWPRDLPPCMGRIRQFALVVGIASALYLLKKGRDDTIDNPEQSASEHPDETQSA
jgi:hypothetical protein